MQSDLVSRIYHSREDRISDLHGEKDRLQYDDNDAKKLSNLCDTFDEYATEVVDAIENYRSCDEEDQINYKRRELIESWALAQAALSKIAWVFRFDGNHAYERMINALKTGAAVDMRGL